MKNNTRLLEYRNRWRDARIAKSIEEQVKKGHGVEAAKAHAERTYSREFVRGLITWVPKDGALF